MAGSPGLGARLRPSAWRAPVDGARPLILTVVFFPLVYYLTHPATRYRRPIDPVVAVFFVLGAMRLQRRQMEASPATQSVGLQGESVAD